MSPTIAHGTDIIRKHTHILVKRVDQASREFEFIASHERVDADGEVILVDGMDLSRYSRNPTLLLHHDHQRPVGRTIALMRQVVEGAPALVGRAVFPEGDDDADRAYGKVQAGLLGAVSIGFLSVETGPPMLPGQRGVTHVKTALLEISLVSLPSCETCVVTAKARKSGTQEEADSLDSAALRAVVRTALREALESLPAMVERELTQAVNLARGRVD